MARRFLVDISADINANIADNIEGDISAADLRSPLLDMMDSLKQDECTIKATGSTLGLATTVAFSDLETVYGEEAGGDGLFLKPAFAQGTIIGNTVPGFSYVLVGKISMAITNNVQVALSIGVNGVQTGFVANAEGTGATEYHTVEVRLFIGSAAADDVFTIMLATPDGTSSINIADAQLIAVILPTNDNS